MARNRKKDEAAEELAPQVPIGAATLTSATYRNALMLQHFGGKTSGMGEIFAVPSDEPLFSPH